MPQSRREREHDMDNQLLTVLARCKACFEQVETGSFEYLLDYNLPDLYRGIHDLYALLGEEDRLEERLKEPDATIT